MSLWKFSHCTVGSGKSFSCCRKRWGILQTRHVLQVIPGIDLDVFEHLAVVVWKGTRYLLIHCALNRLMHNMARRSPSIGTSLDISYWCLHTVLGVQMLSSLIKAGEYKQFLTEPIKSPLPFA